MWWILGALWVIAGLTISKAAPLRALAQLLVPALLGPFAHFVLALPGYLIFWYTLPGTAKMEGRIMGSVNTGMLPMLQHVTQRVAQAAESENAQDS